MLPFSPTGPTVTFPVTTVTSALALTAFSGPGGGVVRLYNAGAATVFLNFGASDVAGVVATGMPLPAGALEVVAIGPKVTHMAVITASGAANVYATPGQGG